MLERFQISFRSALIVFTLLLIFIPTLIILPWMGHYHYSVVKNTIVESGYLQSEWLIESLESEINKSIEYAKENSLSLALDLTSEPSDKFRLKETLNSKTNIDSLFLIDPEQNVVEGVSSTNLEATPSDSHELVPFNYSDLLQQQVLRMLALAHQSTPVEPAAFQENNSIVVLVPVFNGESLSGILVANIKISSLLALTKEHIQRRRAGVYASHYYIVNDDGEVSSEVLSPLIAEEQNEEHSLTFKTLYKNKDTDENVSSASEAYLLESSETLFLGSPFLEPLHSGFSLVAEIPVQSIKNESAGFVYPATVAVILLAVLIMILGFVLLPLFLMPLNSLKEAFENLSKDNVPGEQLLSRLRKSPFSDFNELIEKFDQMFSVRLDSEDKLRESEQNLSLTLQSIGDAVIVTDALGFVTRMNKVAEDITGWQEAEAIRQPLTKVFNIINTVTRNKVENPVEKVISTGSIVDIDEHTALISKSGEEYQIADSAAPIIEDSTVTGVILVFHDISEEYILRQSKNESWEFLTGLVNDMETMLGAMDLDGTLTFVNNTGLIGAGLTEEDVIGKKLWNSYWFEGLEESQQRLKESISKAASGQANTTILKVNMLSVQIWIEFTIHPVYDDKKKVKYLVPEGRNVTERILAEKSLEESRRLTDSILDNASALIFIKDFEYRYLLVNKSVQELYGVTRANIIGKTDAELLGLPPSALPEWEKNFEQVLNEKRRIEFDESGFVKGQHYTFISTKFLLYDSSGEPYAFCGISTDISPRVEIEKQLRGSELRLRQHREQTPIGIVECNEEMKIIDWNPGAEHIFGFSKDDVLGKTVVDLVIPEEHKEEFTSNCMLFIAAKESDQHLYINTNKSGDTLYCEWYCAPLFNEEGNLIALTAEVVDKTSQKLQEEQLRRSQKMDALGKLTGGIAHDFNNILGVVIGYTEMIDASDSLNGSLRKYLKEIKSAGQRGARLTNKLLAFSRQKHARSEVIDVNDLLIEDKNMLEKVLTARVRLIFDLDKELWPVKVDKSDFEDAILNMSINALNAISGNGQITFVTSNTFLEQKSAALYELKEGDYVKLEIIDSGCGISPDILARIFEPFFTTNDETGNGLGLSQVYGFMQRSLGAIHVESELGNGAFFTLFFPRAFEQVKTDEDPKELDTVIELSPNADNHTILVVDDEPALRDLAKEILSARGFTVICANNGSHAMDMLKSNEVCLIISDVIMPIMDGYQLVDQVQRKYPKTKILLTSGFTDRRTIDTKKDEKKKRKLLYKPYTSAELFQRVYELIDNK